MLHPLRFARRLITLVILAAMAYYVISAVQVVTASRSPGAAGVGPSEPVVVVLSTGSTKPGSALLTPDLRLRLHHASELLAVHRARRVVVCASSQAEAASSETYLARHGVLRSHMAAVVAAELPGELAAYVRAGDPRKAVVVADSWQTLWVTHVAGAEGLSLVVSPVTPPHHSLPDEAGSVAVQAAAVAWGRVAGFGQTGFIAG